MEINKALHTYLSKEYLELNKLLFELDKAKYEHEHGDTHFMCDRHGTCVAQDDENGKPNGHTSSCFYCGGELIVFKGNYYHYSAFNDIEEFKKNYKSWNTHNYLKLEYGKDATSEEEEKVFEIQNKINELRRKIFKIKS